MHYPATASDAVVDFEDDASHLVRPSGSDKEVLPFRAYMHGPSSNPSPMKISTRGIDTIGDGNDGDGAEDAGESLQIYLEGKVLVVDNPYDYAMSLPLCDVAGRIVRMLEIAPGTNRYRNLDSGIYLLDTFKFYLP